MNSDKYIIISPCRNEGKYLAKTLKSIVSQTVLPHRWVIVDDGSSDETPEILASFSAQYSFIIVIRRENRGKRSVGPGVIEAFYSGYDKIKDYEYDYICKLDMDLELPQRYFEHLINKMKRNPRIGTCSGKPFYIDPKNGKLISEKCGDENSVGMTKFYRRSCFEQIGGFVQEVMWDGIDGHLCRMYGWLAIGYNDHELQFIHLRAMGSSQKNLLAGRLRHGFGQYFMGTGLTYMTVSAIYRMSRPPIFFGGASMWIGYIFSLLKNMPRFEYPGFRKSLRNYQWACLLKGKRKATNILNDKQEIVWRNFHG